VGSEKILPILPWEAYSSVIPKKRHRAVGKKSGQTNHTCAERSQSIERFNNTLRKKSFKISQM